MHGTADHKTAVGGWFENADPKGVALHAEGRVTFSTAGRTATGLGVASKLIQPHVDVRASSIILCTLESNHKGDAIDYITKDTSADTFTVHFAAPLLSPSTTVHWFVIG